MLKYLLPEEGKFYKANLHTHTTVSDGRGTPEQVKESYKSEGYSVVAFTDHDVLIPHNDLTDEDFLALNGFEFAVGEFNKPWGETKCCHINLIAEDENNFIQPAWHRTDYLYSNNKNYRDQVKFDESKPDFIRYYSAECVNEVIRRGKETGFFVTYNHPVWSLEGFEQYSKYEGMDAMEIVNYGCLVEGYLENNNVQYDELLRQGKRLFCVAADDSHNLLPKEDPKCDRFGGYVMIKAPKLTYKAIMAALKSGEFYSSEAPEIYSLTYDTETKEISVKTSDAARIHCVTDARKTRFVGSHNGGALVNEATFKLDEHDKYVRIVVTDEHGKSAYTNAYWEL